MWSSSARAGRAAGPPLGAEPPRQLPGVGLPLGQDGGQVVPQGLQVQGEGEPLVPLQGEAQQGAGAAGHGVQGQVPGA